jgi:hypothetical protein
VSRRISVKLQKEVSIAYLSASALLLTILLAIVSPSIPKSTKPFVAELVAFSLVGFYGAAIASTWTLAVLVEPTLIKGKGRSWFVRICLRLQFLLFLVGLTFVAFAILFVTILSSVT